MMHATTADEWFDSFIQDLERNPTRRRRAISELYRPLPRSVLAVRVYDFETERCRAVLAGAVAS